LLGEKPTRRDKVYDNFLTELSLKNKASTRSSEELSVIWERVLQRSPIGEQDNFFALGGDAHKAELLFEEIARVFGQELAPVTILQAATIASLATVLNQSHQPKIPPLVQLKAGTKEPPVFIAHGIGGSVLDLVPLANHIHTNHAIYGMQAKGIGGVGEPLDSIELMAQYFLNAIEKIQPRGPYALIGYSLGGLVAFEMARRLSAAGERVALLAMLESYPAKRYLPFRELLRLLFSIASQHATALIRMPLRQALSYLASPTARSAHRSRGTQDGTLHCPPASISYANVMQRMRDAGYLALRRYRPSFYRGKIRFVRAQLSFGFPDDPVRIWGRLADEFELDTVPGDHAGILSMEFEYLASVISRYLKEAFDESGDEQLLCI
jgi:acetoacetyl-CoA synthetase